jgi:hypothetical protein
MEERTMKRLFTSLLLQLSMFVLVVLSLGFSGQNAASAASAYSGGPGGPGVSGDTRFGAPRLQEVTAQRCDGNRLIHETTNEYRMFYDQAYASEQAIAEVTNEYRMFYDPTYASEQAIAAVTERYCAGHP